MAITPKQIKAARSLIDWSQDDLAENAKISVATIRKIELGQITPRDTTLGQIKEAFQLHDIEFLDMNGVRQKPNDITLYEGRDGFVEFFDDVYLTAKTKGGEIVSVCDSEMPFMQPYDKAMLHVDRMSKIKNQVSVRIILPDISEQLYCSDYCSYRTLSKNIINSAPFYVYGDKYAIIMFDTTPSPKVIVIRSATLSRAYRLQFESMWEKATPMTPPLIAPPPPASKR